MITLLNCYLCLFSHASVHILQVPIFLKIIMMEKNDTWKESGVYPG